MNPKPPAAMEQTLWDDELTRSLSRHFGEAILGFGAYRYQNFLTVSPDSVNAVLDFLKLEEEFEFLVDFTAVDYPSREERFELIYILCSFSKNQRIRVKSRIQLGQIPKSIVQIYSTANWLEREVFDMFGIEFAGHPGLRRILLPDDWRGFPLRKDYSILEMDNLWVQEHLGIESGQ